MLHSNKENDQLRKTALPKSSFRWDVRHSDDRPCAGREGQDQDHAGLGCAVTRRCVAQEFPAMSPSAQPFPYCRSHN